MFNMLMEDPEDYYNRRKLTYSKDMHALVVGMLQPDPDSRFTINQIKSSGWMQGPTATPDEIKKHFYKIIGANKFIKKAESEVIKAAQYKKATVLRSGASERQGAQEEEIKFWQDKLTYKPYNF